MKKFISLFFLIALCFVTCCREPESDDRVTERGDEYRMIREWASQYNPEPQAPIELYRIPTTYSEDCVVRIVLDNTQRTRLFGFNDDFHYWGDFGPLGEEYEGVLDGTPDEIIAFSEDVVLPQPEGMEDETDDESDESDDDEFRSEYEEVSTLTSNPAEEEW